MVVAIQDKHVELISPSSVSEVLELKEIIEGSYDHPTKFNFEDQPLNVEMFVCVSNGEGRIKYSNFGMKFTNEPFNTMNILEALAIKCPEVHRTIQENNREIMPENNSIETLLHGHVCFVTLNNLKIPVILKLQKAMQHEILFIWSFKKASIKEVYEKERGFLLDGDVSKQYQFTKLKFILAVNSEGKLLNAPNDLLKKIMGSKYLCKPRYLKEVIEVSEELKMSLKLFESKDYYEKFSTSSLDLTVEKSFNISPPIFCTRTILKSQFERIVYINLFNSIYTNNTSICEPVFPLQVKYQTEIEEDEILLKNEKFPEFPGIKIIRKISESIQSSIYEAIRIFQPDSRIVIKLIHVNDHMAEIKFYEYFTKDPVGCEFIEKPLKIELLPKPTIFMESVGNRIDLFDFIQSNSHLSNDIIKIIFKQIVMAIDYLHCNGIVHRDIKDENVLIDPDTLKIKLIDFGSSAFIKENETKFSEYTGTFAYAPVEVLKGNSFNGPEQDIWCLGILLYILCFKEPPFQSPKEIFQGFLRLPIERPANCIQLIRQMLDPKPENRPNVKDILSCDFLI